VVSESRTLLAALIDVSNAEKVYVARMGSWLGRGIEASRVMVTNGPSRPLLDAGLRVRLVDG